MKAFGIAQTILCASTVASALFAPTPTTPHEGHEHVARRRTEKRWYHDDDHPVRRLFVRQDGGNTAEYGTPGAFPLAPLPRPCSFRVEWVHAYPTGTPTPDQIPQDWLDALKAAQDAGKIPDFPPTTVQNDNPVYPEGSDPNGPEICSSYYKCRADGTLWDAPEGKFGVGFDDGPYDVRPLPPGVLRSLTRLCRVRRSSWTSSRSSSRPRLTSSSVSTSRTTRMSSSASSTRETISPCTLTRTRTCPRFRTKTSSHSLAGRCRSSPTLLVAASRAIGALVRVAASPFGPQLTAPIAYGDSDNRVFAIAKEVFGLEAILWNQECVSRCAATIACY